MKNVNRSMKALIFDMDGTLADFYGVTDWLQDLQNENPRPYKVAHPLYDMDALRWVLTRLQNLGWKVIITSWLAGGSTKAYDKLVREAKLEWLEEYHFPYDEIHLVKYGTTKANCTRHLGGFQILFDDNENVRRGWSLGETVDASKKDILDFLYQLWELEELYGEGA